MKCYGGNVHGMVRAFTSHFACNPTNPTQPWWWHRASDPGTRAREMYDHDPEEFDVRRDQDADLVVIQMGGNDHRSPNEISGPDFYHDYIRLIDDIHGIWPKAIVVVMVRSCLIIAIIYLFFYIYLQV